MGEATHEQATLLLKLYDLRREERLREAIAWLLTDFDVKTIEEFQEVCRPGSREEVSFRMATTFWEMCAALVNRGLIDEDLYFTCVREQWTVWNRLEPIISDIRVMMKDPNFYAELEGHARRYEQWATANRSPEAAQGVLDYLEWRRRFVAESGEREAEGIE